MSLRASSPGAPAKDFELLLRMMYLLWDVASQIPFRREAVLQMVRAMVADMQYVKQVSDISAGKSVVSRHQELFQQFKTQVSRHCEQKRNIPYYANLLHITPTTSRQSSAGPVGEVRCTGLTVPLSFVPRSCCTPAVC